MVVAGFWILIACAGIRLAKRFVQRSTMLWALLSIIYFVGFHAGLVLVAWGFLR